MKRLSFTFPLLILPCWCPSFSNSWIPIHTESGSCSTHLHTTTTNIAIWIKSLEQKFKTYNVSHFKHYIPFKIFRNWKTNRYGLMLISDRILLKTPYCYLSAIAGHHKSFPKNLTSKFEISDVLITKEKWLLYEVNSSSIAISCFKCHRFPNICVCRSILKYKCWDQGVI